MKTIVRLVLFLLVLSGVVGAALLSIDNLNGKLCPSAAGVPVCYVVLVAYLFMLAGVALAARSSVSYRMQGIFSLFGFGWAVAFAIALFASAAEFISSTPICPQSSPDAGNWFASIPLCYLSALLLLLILLFYWLSKRLNSQQTA